MQNKLQKDRKKSFSTYNVDDSDSNDDEQLLSYCDTVVQTIGWSTGKSDFVPKSKQFSSTPIPPFEIILDINGKAVPMILDTGAPLSILNYDCWNSNFSNEKLHSTTIRLRGYNHLPIPVKGQGKLSVQYENQKLKNFPFIIAMTNAPNLLGRDLFYQLRLDWPKLFSVNAVASGSHPGLATLATRPCGPTGDSPSIDTHGCKAVVAKYPDLFSPTLVNYLDLQFIYIYEKVPSLSFLILARYRTLCERKSNWRWKKKRKMVF
jgi:hypothetical protein